MGATMKHMKVADSPALAAWVAPSLEQTARQADAAFENRRLSVDLIDVLTEHGAFRSLLPQEVGGEGVALSTHLESVRNLAKVDASAAWCVNQAAVIALTSLWLPAEGVSEVWAQPGTRVANGPPFSTRLTSAEQGYRLTGHWGFSSGCVHATWMTGACRTEEGGWRIAYFPPEDVSFMDNWDTLGLRATGSIEFKAENLVVPEHLVGDMSQVPVVEQVISTVPSGLLFAVSFGALSLGVAEAALEDALEIATGKKPRYASLKLHENANVQLLLGRALARLRGAKHYLEQEVGAVVEAVSQAGAINEIQRGALRLCGSHVIQEAAEITDVAYKVAGSTAIYADHPLHRRFHDMQVIRQHVQGRDEHITAMGAYAISGHYPPGPMN